MLFSHSKLNKIIECPVSYYLNYVQKITTIKEKDAFAIGSAVHWGLEHNTEDLTEYWEQNFKTKGNYTDKQVMSESMVHGYLKCKDKIYDDLLNYNGEHLEIINEYHELTLYADLPSYKFKEPHKFMGIIDLLLLTEKGFILIDYKTSSKTPEWDKYLDQIYRYIYLLKQNYPDIPVIKIAIINLKKATIKLKVNENYDSYMRRLKTEYELNEEDYTGSYKYINYHVYFPEMLDEKLIEDYFDNLSKECDFAQFVVDNGFWFINFTNATDGNYGKSEYYDIFFHKKDCYLLYKIKDKVYNEDTNTFDDYRPCIPLDLQTIEKEYIGTNKIINHYDDYKKLIENNENLDDYVYDEELINKYNITYLKELEVEEEEKNGKS